jgi:hypothetical protein
MLACFLVAFGLSSANLGLRRGDKRELLAICSCSFNNGVYFYEILFSGDIGL